MLCNDLEASSMVLDGILSIELLLSHRASRTLPHCLPKRLVGFLAEVSAVIMIPTSTNPM